MDEALLEFLAECSGDPVAFALGAFPWGEPGTPLAGKRLEEWQLELLGDIRDGLRTPGEVIQIARASGHGIGKSALVCIVILWAISTMPDTRGVVTANTENQLRTKTWAELSKWYHMFVGRSLFKLTATSIFSVDPEHEKTWRIDAVPWNEANAEAFAGLHNEGRRVLLLFDEASTISDIIWETAQGALTDDNTELLWLAFGNPTKNTGRFRECFRSAAWKSKQIDSRTVGITNKKILSDWVEEWGEDSDFVRVRIRGEFPRSGDLEFIGLDLVEAAMRREMFGSDGDPLILGVDVARFGEDSSVLFFRRGLDARSKPYRAYKGVDTMALAGHVARAFWEERCDAVFVDEGGVGGGVVDRLRQLNVPVMGVQFGGASDRYGAEPGRKMANKRAEIWDSMRQWMERGCLPPQDTALRDELVAPTYGFNVRDEIKLESKESMKKRGVASPDVADALAITFAFPVLPRLAAAQQKPQFVTHEYDPYAMESV